MASSVSSHTSNFETIHELLQTKIRSEDIQTDCIINKVKKGSSGSKSSLSGGNGDMISLNDFKIILILAHGRIELNETTVRTPEIHPTMDVNAFPNVDNLAYMALAPTGFVNIGNSMELEIYKKIIDNEFKRALEEEIMKQQFTPVIQEIEDKANQVIGSNKLKVAKKTSASAAMPESSSPSPSPSPSPRSVRPAPPQYSEIAPPPYSETLAVSPQESFFSRVCKFCFTIVPSLDIVEKFLRLIESGEIVGYTFKNFFNICKTILPSISLDGGAPKRKRSQNNMSLCSVSPDLCISLFDELRNVIKKFDLFRFDAICKILESSTPTYDISSLLLSKQHRCRKISIIKGFSSVEVLPFVNKYLAYNTLTDKVMNMGVSILSFKINSSGKVKCVVEDIDAEELMKNITVPQGVIRDPKNPNNITYWSNMQACISYCTASIGRNKTVFVIDLSCSSFPFTAHHPIESMLIGLSGGNRKHFNLKQKSGKGTGTRKIKNKSKNIKYMRNKKKYKNKTKRANKKH